MGWWYGYTAVHFKKSRRSGQYSPLIRDIINSIISLTEPVICAAGC